MVVRFAAAAFFLQVVIGFTGMPRWRANRHAEADAAAPAYIVVLGGGGIPSETGLMRTYCAAAIGTNYPSATFIVSLPCDGDPETNSVGRMRDELVLRGLPRHSIEMEHDGLNTHEQAASVARILGPAALTNRVLVVTSPYHIRRALLCFRKVGFTQVDGSATLGIGAEADAGAAGPLDLRYTFWATLHAEIDWVRECVALLYYRLRGWI
ncbi:MAG: YdcF family protein [Candidatus Hydrogenedentes bacterium]|nr:YdcF family protein [Candidatus Hydrogenedentota bacterium]